MDRVAPPPPEIKRITDNPGRLVSAVLAMAIAGSFLVFLLSTWWLRESLLSQGRKRATQVSRDVLTDLEQHLRESGVDDLSADPQIIRRVDRWVKFGSYGHSIKLVRLYDLRGILVYSSDGNGEGSPPADDDLDTVRRAAAGEELSVIHADHPGGSDLEFFSPIRNVGGETIAVCEVYSDISALTLGIERSTNSMLIAGSASLLLYSILLLLVSYALVRRTEGEREARAKSERRAAELRDLARAGTLVSGLAHQLRNPVTVLQGIASALGKKSATDEQMPFIRALGEETERLGAVIEAFLRFARPVNGGAMKPTCDLRQQIDLALSGLAKVSPAFESVVSSPDDLRIAVPAELVRESISMVIENGVQAAAISGATPRIEVDASADGPRVRVTVRDNGPGFPVESVVEGEISVRPFVSTKKRGTGLGLAFVRRLLDEYGGRLSLRNRDGGGAEVVLAFPAESEKGESR